MPTVELSGVGDRDAPEAAPLVQNDDAPAEGGRTRLEGLAGRVVEVGAVSDPLQNEKLRLVESLVHTFSLAVNAELSLVRGEHPHRFCGPDLRSEKTSLHLGWQRKPGMCRS